MGLTNLGHGRKRSNMISELQSHQGIWIEKSEQLFVPKTRQFFPTEY